MRLNAKWLGAFFVAGIVVLSACSKEDTHTEQPSNPSTDSGYKIKEGTGEKVKLEFAGELDLSGMNGTNKDSRAYTLITKNGEYHTAPVIDMEKYKATPRALLIRLAEESDPTNITEILVTDLKIEGNRGSYKFSYKKEVALQAGQSFSTGKWYISAIYGGTAANPVDFELTPRFLTDTEGSTTGSDFAGASMVIPWTRIYTKANPSATDTDTNPQTGMSAAAMSQLSPDLGRNTQLRLKPDGVLFRVRPVSRLVDNVLYSNVRVFSQDIVIGTHKYEKPTTLTATELQSGSFPKVTSTAKAYNSTNDAAEAQVSTKDLKGFFLPSGGYGRAELLVWGFPVEGQATDTSKKTEILVVSSGRSHSSVALYLTHPSRWTTDLKVVEDSSDPDHGKTVPYEAQDIVNSHKIPVQDNVIAKRWGAQPAFQKVKKKEYKRGVAYLMLPVVDADVQITERYTSLQGKDTGARYGMIEIYNPTLRNIDISDYALARVACTGMEDANPDTQRSFWQQVEAKGILYAFPVQDPLMKGQQAFVNSDLPFSVSEGTGPATSTTHLFRDALVLPIGRKLGGSATLGAKIQGTRSLSSNFQLSTINTPSITPLGSTAKPEYVAWYKDYTTQLGGSTAFNENGSNILEPGQTMIILTNGYRNATDYAATTALINDIKRAIGTKYCKYVVAMNNAQDETAVPLSANAGVLTLGDYDIPMLLKKRTSPEGIVYYHLIDGLWSDGNNAYAIAGYLGYTGKEFTVFPDKRGLFYQYIKARVNNKAGLHEKRSVGGAIFNNPIGFEPDQVETLPYSPGTDNFASFGVLLFNQYSAVRDAGKYTQKW